MVKSFAGILFLLVSHIFFLNAQADSILSLQQDIRGKALWSWYNQHRQLDSAALFPALDQMHTAFQQHGESELANEIWYLKKYHTSLFYPYDQKGIDILDQAILYARDHRWPVQEAELYIHKGLMLLEQLKTISAFENLLKGYEMIQALGPHRFSNVKEMLLGIGDAYSDIGDYESAIRFLRASHSVNEANPDPVYEMQLMNTTGVCYQRMMAYDSAITCFKLAHEAAIQIKNDFWIGLTNGNLGNIYYLEKDFTKALPLMEEDFTTSVKFNEIGSALNAALGLASIYLQQNQPIEAEKYIRFSKEHVDRNDNKAMATFYENLYLFSKLKGDYKQATTYIDSARLHKAQYDATVDKAILEKAKLQLEMERHASEIKSLELLRKRQVLMRNGLLAIFLLSAMIAMLMVNRNVLRRKKELELAHAELQHYTNTIREKNELIDSVTDKIEKMRESEGQHLDERTGHLTELLQASILTEEDWRHFRELFDKVHPGFFIRLKEKMTDLSPAETRLLALTKLKLAPREMASMLGISYEAIKKTRQRLRKKINLPEEGSLDELVDMI